MTVGIDKGILRIRDKEVFLFGGEVQYFRLRPKDFDEAETKRIWAKTLDMMRDGGMNFVTTYVPWDYHESARDKFDFSGARDLDAFLGMCYERGFHVQVKPGPYITAEWPHGPRTFGAVPLWIKAEHPETLVITADGSPLSFDLLKSKVSRQCTYMHPFYLERVRKWYDAVFPIFLKYIREKPCIFSVQIDNETNLFWNDRYVVDYSPVALANYRDYLSTAYGGEISKLNSAYKSAYKTFAEVEPPKKRPKKAVGSQVENPIHIDWFEAGFHYVDVYLKTLRKMIEDIGLREPEVLFTTNDTPALTPRLGRIVLFWRGSMKCNTGLPTMDSYPRCDPLSRQLDDISYQTDSSARLFDFYGDKYPMKNGSWVMGAEMQGSMFEIPILKIRVRPEATARQVTKGIGSGIKAYAVFIIRQGYNLNNTIYKCQSSIDENGVANERFHVLAKAAKGLMPVMEELNRAEGVDAPIAVLVNRDYQVPLGGANLSTVDFWHTSYGGAFGWLKRSGYVPKMIDIKDVELDDLKKFKAVMYLDPGLTAEREIAMLLAYMKTGGHLVLQGWPSFRGLNSEGSEAHREWMKYVPLRFALQYRRGSKLSFFIDRKRFNMKSHAPISVWELPDKDCDVFLKMPAGGWTGIRRPVGNGSLAYFSCDHSKVFNTSTLYKMTDEDLVSRRTLAAMMMGWYGVEKALDWTPARVEVWARKAPKSAFLFVTNDGDAVRANIRPALSRLGFDANTTYSTRKLYAGTELPAIKGAQLSESGLDVELAKWESEILRLTPSK